MTVSTAHLLSCIAALAYYDPAPALEAVAAYAQRNGDTIWDANLRDYLVLLARTEPQSAETLKELALACGLSWPSWMCHPAPPTREELAEQRRGLLQAMERGQGRTDAIILLATAILIALVIILWLVVTR